MAVRKRLGDILIESGKITYEELEKAIEYQKKNFTKLGEALVRLGYLTDQQIIDTVSFQMNIPKIDLENVRIDESIVKLIPSNVVKKYTVIPVGYRDGKLVLATSNPFSMNAIDDVAFITKKQVTIGLATEDLIKRHININYSSDGEEKVIAALKNEFKDVDIMQQENLSEELKNAPTVKIVDNIINKSIKMKASDIHVEPFENDVKIRIRVNGTLANILLIPKHSYTAVCTRIKIMANMNIAENRIPQDGRIELQYEGRPFDLRVSSLPTVFGEKIVMRILNREDELMHRSLLGFTKSENVIIDKFQRTPYGIVLVSGPTGSGKTTTLYTMLKEQNDVTKNIVTVEDPVEYMFEGINQVQVNNKAGLSFAAGLRSILRQDPDIIMLGEIRDEETAGIAVRAAITGHMVLSTIHTNDAASSITRLTDMKIPGYLVADAIVGIIAQRLVKTLCPHCKVQIQADEATKKILGIEKGKSLKIYKAGQCLKCNRTGYIGRKAIHEVLNIDEEIKALIINDESSDVIKNVAIEKGMTTLKENCKDLVFEGKTSFEEMCRAVFV